jgi:hypothetical protein
MTAAAPETKLGFAQIFAAFGKNQAKTGRAMAEKRRAVFAGINDPVLQILCVPHWKRVILARKIRPPFLGRLKFHFSPLSYRNYYTHP